MQRYVLPRAISANTWHTTAGRGPRSPDPALLFGSEMRCGRDVCRLRPLEHASRWVPAGTSRDKQCAGCSRVCTRVPDLLHAQGGCVDSASIAADNGREARDRCWAGCSTVPAVQERRQPAIEASSRSCLSVPSCSGWRGAIGQRSARSANAFNRAVAGELRLHCVGSPACQFSNHPCTREKREIDATRSRQPAVPAPRERRQSVPGF